VLEIVLLVEIWFTFYFPKITWQGSSC